MGKDKVVVGIDLIAFEVHLFFPPDLAYVC